MACIKCCADNRLAFLQDDDNTSRGFGFVNFEDADGAQAAVSALNGKEMEDKELYVGRAQKKSEREAALKQRCRILSYCHACQQVSNCQMLAGCDQHVWGFAHSVRVVSQV